MKFSKIAWDELYDLIAEIQDGIACLEVRSWINKTYVMWIIFSTAAAVFAALVIILSKIGIQHVSPVVVFGIQSICMAIITWSIILSKKLELPSISSQSKTWAFILAAGVLTTASSLFSFYSLKIGHASRTSSFEKISLVLSVILSIIFFKDKINLKLCIGVALMASGALFIAFSETGKA